MPSFSESAWHGVQRDTKVVANKLSGDPFIEGPSYAVFPAIESLKKLRVTDLVETPEQVTCNVALRPEANSFFGLDKFQAEFVGMGYKVTISTDLHRYGIFNYFPAFQGGRLSCDGFENHIIMPFTRTEWNIQLSLNKYDQKSGGYDLTFKNDDAICVEFSFPDFHSKLTEAGIPQILEELTGEPISETSSDKTVNLPDPNKVKKHAFANLA